MRRPSLLRLLLLAVVLLAACASPAPAAPAAPSPAPAAPAASPSPSPSPSASGAGSSELGALVDDARTEGELDLSWGEGSLGGTQGAAQLAAAFNAHYGLDTKVQFTPGPTDVELAATIGDEYQAGRPASSDVYHGSAGPILPLLQANALQSVDWTSWSPYVTSPDSVAPNGTAVSVETEVPGILYNSAVLTGGDVPQSMQDLLKPVYTGRIASTPYASGFDALDVAWGDASTLSYVKSFSAQLGGLIRCTEASRILSGEFDLLALDCNQSNGLAAKEHNQPLGFVVPSDVQIAMDMYLAVPKNAAHPALAQLWVSFLLSPQAQDILYSYDYMDSAAVPGSRTAALLSGIQDTSHLVRDDVQFYQDNDAAHLSGVVNQIVQLLEGH